VTIAKRPFCVGQDGKNEQVSWVKSEAEYFSERDWTTQISLNCFNKIVFPGVPKRDQLKRMQEVLEPVCVVRSGLVALARFARCSNQSIRNAIYIGNAKR
jgi:hypothetical protein